MHPSGEASRTVQALRHACEVPLLEPLNQTFYCSPSAHLTVVLRHGSRVERFDRVPSSRLTRLHRTHCAETDRTLLALCIADLTLHSTFANYTIVACYENLARMATQQHCARGLTRGTSALFPHRVRLVTRMVSHQRSTSDTEVGVAVQQVVHLGSRDFVGIGDMVSGMLKGCALCAACARQAFITCEFTVVSLLQLCSREGRLQIRRPGQSCNHCAGHPAVLPTALCSSGTHLSLARRDAVLQNPAVCLACRHGGPPA